MPAEALNAFNQSPSRERKMSKKSKNIGSRKGRPRKAGDRYPSGKLKPEKPQNEIVIERRKELCDDITMASNPLDAALANGWISPADHRAGHTFAAMFRQAQAGGPSAPTAMDISTPTSVVDYRGVSFNSLTSAEVSRIWDSAFERDRPIVGDAAAEERERRAEEAAERWKALNKRLPSAVREEMRRVCVDESWPQWINHRSIGKNKLIALGKRKAEDVTDQEWADAKAWFESRWEFNRDLLLQGCKIVRESFRPVGNSIESVPTGPTPGPTYVAETTSYVSPGGEPVLEVVRLARSRPSRQF
jgi:hypothetical protein